MKKLSFFLSIFVLLFLSACSSPKVPEAVKNIPSPLPDIKTPDMTAVKNLFGTNVKKEYFTGGKIRSEFIMSDDSGQNGLLKKYGYNGKLNSTVNIVRGVKHGTETLFDQNGRVIKKTPYSNGRKQGVLEAYYPNGDIMAQITYNNNTRHGKAVKYNKDGSINHQATFNNGRLAS
jgi:antitoxin component YwqK of YwqJK toxin-antitoxin module